MNDPNNIKWSNDDTRIGKKLMKASGWDDGKGLGKHEDGNATHVKTKRKDDVLGIGYEAKGQSQQWSAQSVGFADILKRMNTQSPTPPLTMMARMTETKLSRSRRLRQASSPAQANTPRPSTNVARLKQKPFDLQKEGKKSLGLLA